MVGQPIQTTDQFRRRERLQIRWIDESVVGLRDVGRRRPDETLVLVQFFNPTEKDYILMFQNIIILAVLWIVCATAAPIDTIIKISYISPTCLPVTLPEAAVLECYLRDVPTTSGVFCNCSDGLVLKWSAANGVYTPVGNFTLNTCGLYSTMYTSINGVCGSAEPYDAYLAHQVEVYTSRTQQGTATLWPENATIGAGLLCSFLLFAFLKN